MAKYIFKRMLGACITLLLVSFIAFTMVNLIPADPAEVALRVNDTTPSEEAIEEIRIKLGLDQPFLVRYTHWLSASLQGDFGTSFTNANRSVFDELARSFPYTLTLAGISLVLLIAVSIPLGVLSAVYKDHWLDKIVRTFIFASTAMPNFWLAFILIWFFSIKLYWLPSSGATSWSHYVLPSITLCMAYIATYIRLIRNSMLDTMQDNYVSYARARGLSEYQVIWKHLLKNSLQTSMTALGIGVVRLIAGTVVIESIFAIPGLGRLALSAIFNRDYPVIQAYILVMGCLFVLSNLIIDILQTVIDPRLKSEGEYQ
ncbi:MULTISPECIES: nickel/cobalt ABC transporter permease [unclassified Agarivorans]|uniref:nickel/cobalt ABC transporter permease n=1 Tax=unclassified Agarivorans TaxID=2636026 RepID=UPI0026E2A664|nr:MULTISPECIES: nickel/cobalt ABC transporter permease [unclassified Agarivorans]MDO6686361.1 ABC transporter permease subunit [Agarivorans sp. 3_MG-2023]MDO6713663.1 ABC transporter permease subunit [Agarivorans sp. 2_MG-2023]MDO6761984.1 ABC transporter permease subunit [Agarivorans sp. 1_MG-2023]